MKALRIYALVFLFMLPAFYLKAQDSSETKIFTIVEKMPQFKGGDQGLKKFLIANIRYPDAAIEKKISGTIYISFVVLSTGKIADVKVLKGISSDTDHLLEDEALRVVSAMPDWNPGTQNKKEVNVQYNLPIKFSLPEQTKNKTYLIDYFEKGNNYFNEGNYALAIDAYESSIIVEKNNVNAYFNRGVCYQKIGDVFKACLDWKKAADMGDEGAKEMLVKYCGKTY